MSYMEVASSSASPEWPTPQWLVDQLAAKFGSFDTDPSASAENAKATAERRAIGESLRKLVSADAPPPGPGLDEEHWHMMARVQTARTDLARQAPRHHRPDPPGQLRQPVRRTADARSRRPRTRLPRRRPAPGRR